MKPLLEMRAISRSFPGVKARDHVNLSVAQGEIRAVVGENGAGRSTLMKALSGVYPAGATKAKSTMTVRWPRSGRSLTARRGASSATSSTKSAGWPTASPCCATAARYRRSAPRLAISPKTASCATWRTAIRRARAPLMEVENWSVRHPEFPDRHVIRDVSFNVRADEVVGIAGLMGAGRTKLAMSLFRRSCGRNIEDVVRIGGRPVRLNTVSDAIRAGLAYVTEDRKSLGLILGDSIQRNITLANLGAVFNRGLLDDARETQVAEGYRKRMKIRTPGVFQRVVNLSGGNQQKIVLSKWLFSDPDVLILDEPTRGIDVGAKFEIYVLINALSEQGKGVVTISSKMPELLGMCDRIYVMNQGAILGELTAAEASQERIMSMIVTTEETV